jgi:hypothetical protein
MKAINYILTFFILIMSVISCDDFLENDYYSNHKFVFNFTEDDNGWTGDFADYPASDSVFYELAFEHAFLPVPLDTTDGSLMITGNNHSDDLFMYIKKQISGLEPYTRYEISFNIELASEAPTNAFGIGGAPGEGVTLKAGAVLEEPNKILNEDDFYVMNIDKGNQINSGEDMLAIGHVGVSDTTTLFTIINRNNQGNPIIAKSDAQGTIWVIIGTDSGFEGITTLYYTAVEVIFIKND